jgi:SSS family solute:Na+ symporter
VLRTDRWQLPLIVSAVALSLFYVARIPVVEPVSVPRFDPFSGMTPWSWLSVVVVVGGMYVVGPDLCSRVLVADSDRSARRGAFAAGLALLPLAFAIVAIGVRLRNTGVALEAPSAAWPWLLTRSGAVPPMVAGFAGAGLLAALLSSADTCLLTAASVLELDVFGSAHAAPRQRRAGMRLVVLTGAASVLIAGLNPSIIGNLLLAYAFYSGGLLLPLLLAAFPRVLRRLDRRAVWWGMLAGGATPVAAVLTGTLPDLPSAGLAGVAVSAVILAVGSARSFRRTP